MSQPQQPHNFFSLPLEIRLIIYRHALINKKRLGGRFSRSVIVQHQKITVLENPEDRTMAPSLLRTSKQIYREALPILYSENEFLIDQASRFLMWLRQIGPVNIKLLKYLRIFPHADYSPNGYAWPGRARPDYSGPTWCKLLNKLADEAIGLGYVCVYLDANAEWGHYGAGRDSNFARALGRMKVSQKMEIDGYFLIEWLAYLEQKIGMPVWDAQGRSEGDLRSLRKYQRIII